jgi:hypothetical protein
MRRPDFAVAPSDFAVSLIPVTSLCRKRRLPPKLSGSLDEKLRSETGFPARSYC